jgi:Zn-dependent protease with chaperone function
MAMTTEQFVEMVGRLEEYAKREPAKYRLRVGLLAALGYAYILFVLLTLALLVFLFGWWINPPKLNFWVLTFCWMLVVLAWLLVSSLRVKLPAPEGVRLKREESPDIFALADELADKLEAPRPHVIQVDADFNASLAQVPRLGPFGWQRNYLTLGLPLMQALTPAQFRAVLAHELGHLSGNHGRFGSWIYRVRLTWVQLLTRLEREEHWGSFLFTKFVNWYAPYFNAYSFVLARRHEYDADRASARLTGGREAAVALAAVQVKGAYLSQKYWPEIFKRADVQREPTAGAFAGMWHALRAGVAPEEARRRRATATRTLRSTTAWPRSGSPPRSARRWPKRSGARAGRPRPPPSTTSANCAANSRGASTPSGAKASSRAGASATST